jgi:hypothetical protein
MHLKSKSIHVLLNGFWCWYITFLEAIFRRYFRCLNQNNYVGTFIYSKVICVIPHALKCSIYILGMIMAGYIYISLWCVLSILSMATLPLPCAVIKVVEDIWAKLLVLPWSLSCTKLGQCLFLAQLFKEKGEQLFYSHRHKRLCCLHTLVEYFLCKLIS